jgi:hypothetical protein
MKWADAKRLFMERFDGAFFITIGLIVYLRVITHGLTILALSPIMAKVYGVVNQTLITSLPNGAQVVNFNNGPFRELNPYAPLSLVPFIITLIIFMAVVFFAALDIKQIQIRHMVYSLVIAFLFADFLNDALNLASVYLHFLTPVLVLCAVWLSLAVIPMIVGVREVELLLKKQPTV